MVIVGEQEFRDIALWVALIQSQIVRGETLTFQSLGICSLLNLDEFYHESQAELMFSIQN